MENCDFADDALASSTALTSFDTIDSLLSQYQALRRRCEQIAAFVTDETAGAMHYFLTGNAESDGRYRLSVGHLFKLEGALAALDAAFWSKAMQLTDVLDTMPQKRRDEWHKSITERTCPAFEEAAVRGTLEALLAQRAQFLAERVDGIFRGLSGEHVTNAPQGFGKRMIIANVLSVFGYVESSKCGLINDLRCVVAKFMKRDEPKYNASSGLVTALKSRWGEWVEVDGGAMKIRLYRKGTAHLEVHPDMAWRLNTILAHLHPRAIPPEHRERPRRRAKDVALIQRPLPFAVVELLADLEPATVVEETGDFRQPRRHRRVLNAVSFRYGHVSGGKHLLAEAEGVLASLGGARVGNYWQFDYAPYEAIHAIVASGCVPDDKAHQFYPTPEKVAEAVVRAAQIGDASRCLEPSAGLGNLADRMPKDRTLCVEVSALRADVLRAKGYAVERADFLAWSAANLGRTFDRVVMNPPFDQGRWHAHLEAAAGMLAPGGRLVAVLPISARNGVSLPGCAVSCGEVFERAFAGASVDVVILLADKTAS